MMLGNIRLSTALSTKYPVWNTLHWNPGLCDKPALFFQFSIYFVLGRSKEVVTPQDKEHVIYISSQ
jgi:hypothetical protein